MSAHAMLGPSSAKRWLTCTPSAALEATFPPTSSTYADEGTLAHKLAELMLRKHFSTMKPSLYKANLAKIQSDKLYQPEMLHYIEEYVEQIKAAMAEAKAVCEDPLIAFEKRLDFSEYVPDGWGTGDVVIIADGQMQVIDLKYGKGVPVDAVDNPQCRLYGLGAVLEFSVLYDIQTVKNTVIQPRLDSISSEELQVAELIEWAETYVKPRARLASEGEGEFVPGDHCHFCRANATCTARSNVGLAVLEFTDAPLPLLMPEDFAEILPKLDILEKWMEDFKTCALKLVLNEGFHIPGYKLVEGRSNRVITDAVGLTVALTSGTGIAPTLLYKAPQMLGLADLEKVVGKKRFTELAEPYIIKPAGKPALVPDTDKRPELATLDAAIRDFADEAESEE